jgi:hypothetical protein
VAAAAEKPAMAEQSYGGGSSSAVSGVNAALAAWRAIWNGIMKPVMVAYQKAAAGNLKTKNESQKKERRGGVAAKKLLFQ